jgi:chromosomal replication initiator protein
MRASYPQIGDLFGRDHSTVIHATTVVARRIKEDPSFQATVERLERMLRGQ